MTGYMYVLGHCYGCKRPFTFNADWVPSIRIDGVKEPICRDCVEIANPKRIANGLEPIHIHPDAYEPGPA
jgi:hypothetical protein